MKQGQLCFFQVHLQKSSGKHKQVCNIFLNEQTNTHTLNLFTDQSVHDGYGGQLEHDTLQKYKITLGMEWKACQ